MVYVVDDTRGVAVGTEEEKKAFPWGILVAILPAIATMIVKRE